MSGRRIVLFGWADSVHIQRWADGLTSRGFRIKLISLGRKPAANVETVIIPRVGRYSYVTQAARAAREAKAFEPDLVHAHYVTGYGLWAWKAGIHPTLLSVWGSDVNEFAAGGVKRMIVRYLLGKADHITVASYFLENTVKRLASKIGDRISVIPFGVAIPPDASDPTMDGPTRICFIKVHYRRYGPDILLRAMAKAITEVPDIQLSIAGEGEFTPEMRRMTEDLHLQGNVRFSGFIDNSKIYSFIRGHHFMVMPSLSEAFGVAVLETGACSRAVIASSVGGVPEVVRDGETGILVPAGDVDALATAIVQLARDRKRCVMMGRAGYAFVKENFDWEKSLDAMGDLYERLIYASTHS